MSHNDVLESADSTSALDLRVVANYDELSVAAADIVGQVITENPGSAITLPTGETPRGMYEEMTRRIVAGELDFTSVQFFCMDDYLGKGIDDETSLTAWLDEAFLTPAGLRDASSIHYMPTLTENPDAAAADYDRQVRELGGFRLAVLGIGNNGHIGFNEPGSAVDSRTRVVDLTAESREQNAAYYDSGEAIPSQAMTLGLGTILEAGQIVLIVSGRGKAGIVKQALEGPVTPEVPGSYLRTVADRVTVILDEDAASLLTR